MNLRNVLIILLVLFVLAALGFFPGWGWHAYGYWPSGGFLLLVVVLVLLLAGGVV